MRTVCLQSIVVRRGGRPFRHLAKLSHVSTLCTMQGGGGGICKVHMGSIHTTCPCVHILCVFLDPSHSPHCIYISISSNSIPEFSLPRQSHHSLSPHSLSPFLNDDSQLLLTRRPRIQPLIIRKSNQKLVSVSGRLFPSQLASGSKF